MIVDGTDNFPTRYLVNDASVWHDIPVVHGSIYRFEGQVTVFKPRRGPVLPLPLPRAAAAELAPSCAEGGVLGVLPGIVGTLQTNEALKLALDIGDPLIGRLLLFDALATEFTEVQHRAQPGLPGLRRAPDDHRVHRLRRVLHADERRGLDGAQMTVVRLPPVLRSEAGGAREVEADGRDGPRAARGPVARLPALGERVYDGAEIRPYVNVYVDGEDVRTRGGLDAPVATARHGHPPARDGGRFLTAPAGRRSRAAEPPSATTCRP